MYFWLLNFILRRLFFSQIDLIFFFFMCFLESIEKSKRFQLEIRNASKRFYLQTLAKQLVKCFVNFPALGEVIVQSGVRYESD